MSGNITLYDAAPIAKFVDKTLAEAVSLRASDIHFEVFDNEFIVRYRVDGELITLDPCSNDIAKPVLSRIKVLSNLNIAENRLPQDGSISRNIAGNEVEFRVSCLPTQFGESIVLRVLNNAADNFQLDEILKNDKDLRNFLKNVTDYNGLTLFVGPTGCGKSTTLYSVLREINREDIKILTCEDPAEQRIDGISQSNINAAAGFTFSCALRSFLRHDPDVIFVGEIRDNETADLAIRAAITGHTVLSTLHANSTKGAIPRLLDLGVDSALLSEALVCVVHQQLVKGGTSCSGRVAKFETLFINNEIKIAIKNCTID